MAVAAKDLHGTLDALVLKTLSWGPRHGYAIARWLEDTSGVPAAIISTGSERDHTIIRETFASIYRAIDLHV